MSLDTRDQAPKGAPDARQESDAYLEKRSLKSGSAGWVLLAGLGVSYVISGDYSGWNGGLGQGGFGGLLIAFVIIAVMYFCMVLGMAELLATHSDPQAREVRLYSVTVSEKGAQSATYMEVDD